MNRLIREPSTLDFRPGAALDCKADRRARPGQRPSTLDRAQPSQYRLSPKIKTLKIQNVENETGKIRIVCPCFVIL